MNKISLFLVVGMGLSMSSVSYGACSDIVLRMQDPSKPELSKGREITMILNCHEGSYQFPAASTVHMFEWKSGMLCHKTRTCGNVKYWNGHFNIGAAWTWGNSVSDIVSNTRFVNNFRRLAEGARPGNGGDVTRNNFTCIQENSPHVVTVGKSGDNDARCYPKSIRTVPQWHAMFGEWTAQGATVGGVAPVEDPSITHVCVGRQLTGNGIGDNSGNTNSFGINSCANTIIGGPGGAGYSPVFGIESGTTHNNGNIETDFNETTLQVNFALDFGQIERYCARPQNEVCF